MKTTRTKIERVTVECLHNEREKPIEQFPYTDGWKLVRSGPKPNGDRSQSKTTDQLVFEREIS